MTTFYVDNEEMSMRELMKLAKSLGYEEPSGIYMTSRACKVLMDAGYKVSDRPTERQPMDQTNYG